MADEDSETPKPKEANKNNAFKARIATKLPQGPVRRLFQREIGGKHRYLRNAVQNQIFQKLPGRLGFELKSMVDDSVLLEGHVFLGFTKDGQFFLSYTLDFETNETSPYPTAQVYRLQWWRFHPYKRFKKAAEVRLFGEEDINVFLFISMCEWPTDSSRIMIHGYCPRSKNEEKIQCYVTITATPPIHPCEDCMQLRILRAQSCRGLMSSDEPAPRCLTHSFTVHTKYELAPPYPAFSPKVFLKLDGVVVLNTGESLVAVSVDIEDNHSSFGFSLYSPRVNRSISNLSTASSGQSEDVISLDSQDEIDTIDTTFNLLGASSPCVPAGFRSPAQSPCSNNGFRSPQSPCSNTATFRNPTTPKDATNTSVGELRSGVLRERHPSNSAGKENMLNKQLGSPLAMGSLASGEGTTSPARDTPTRLSRPIDVYNFECSTPTPRKELEDGSSPEYCEESPRARTALALSAFQQGTRLSGERRQSTDEGSQDSVDKLEPDSDKREFFERPGGVLRASNPASQRSLSLAPPTDSHALPRMAISPGYKFDHAQSGGSTCSSCVSSPIILQSESQCFFYSVRRYAESYGPPRPDSPVDMEDDLNMAYHSLLPLTVHGANYCQMRLLTNQCLMPQMPCVVVKQLTLDIEHYLGEALRTSPEWGHRYLAITDYDVQIVEICAESAEVIAMVFVLIRARPPKPKDRQHVHGMRAVPKLYQTGLKLIWSLRTGAYHTLDIDDLTEINQSDLFRKRWQPDHKITESLQRKFYVPSSYAASVNVLTNEPVIKGKSLRLLLDRHHYVAILL